MGLGLDFNSVGAGVRPAVTQGAAPVMPASFNSGGLLNIKSNAELEAEDRAKAAIANSQQEIIGLSGYLHRQWEAAKRAKVPHELKMLEDLRQRDGVYDPQDLRMLEQQGGSDIFMMLTATKCRAAAAWIKDTMLPADDRPWCIEPTPIPTLPPDAQQIADAELEEYKAVMTQRLQASLQLSGMQGQDFQYSLEGHIKDTVEKIENKRKQELLEEAKSRARAMEDKIEDQLIEGGYYDALADCIEDLVTFPAAIMHGPVVRRRKKMQWVQDETTKQWESKVEDSLTTEFERVSPFDIYPMPTTFDIQKGGFFHRQKLTVEDLAAMIGVPGYHEASIRAAIDAYGRGGLREWINADAPRETAEGRPFSLFYSDTIDCLSFWGKVPGSLLLEFGMSAEDVPDRSLSYEVNAWLVGSYVIRAILNPNPLSKRPYGMASYEKIPGSFWGKGPVRLGRDCQRMCNAAARAIANNMAIGSGPQVVVKDTDRLPAGENIEALYPWKIWQLKGDKSGRGGSDVPIDFFQPNTMVDQLLAVYGYFARLFDDVVTIPASAYGSDKGAGAAKTASGQAMLENNAGRTMKGVIYNVDQGLVRVPIDNLFMHEMVYGDDDEIKGDLVVKAKGAAALMVKEVAQMRRNDFLRITNNPVDLQIMGLDGRAAVLREVASTLEMEKNVVPDEDEMSARMQGTATMEQQNMANGASMMGQGVAMQPGVPGENVANMAAENRPMQDLSGQHTAGGADFRMAG